MSEGGGASCTRAHEACERPKEAAAITPARRLRSAVPEASAGLEHQYRQLPAIEVDEVLRLMRDVRSEVLAHDDVPERGVPLVEFFLDEVCDLTLCAELVHRLLRALDRLLLHGLAHVRVLHDVLPLGGRH